MALPGRAAGRLGLWSLALFTATSLLVAGAPPPPGLPKPVRLANGHLQIGLDGERGALVELLDLTTQHNHAEAGPEEAGLWKLEFQPGAEPRQLSPAQAGTFRAEAVAGRRRALRLTWTDFPFAPGLSVEATVELSARAPMSAWSIGVKGLRNLQLHKVHFPRISHIPPQANELLAVPVWQGQQAAEPRRMLAGPKGGRRLEWDYPGILSLQCLAWYQQGGPGLYVACDDTAAFRKGLACFGSEKGAGCEVVHLPESQAAQPERWTLPYRVHLGTFKGDWFTAAERYRAWATNQVWATESRLARGTVPDWILNTGLWVWNRGRSQDVLSPATALQRRLDLPVSVFWHWWHGCSYDTGFPEYLPPREGAEPFKAALAAAHRDGGVHALVYMNQRIWGMTTKSWQEEGAERFAVKGADGKVHPEVYNTFTKAPCAPMCMGTEFWRSKYAGLAERAVRELGVDGIYMDQACTSLSCYDPAHGHPQGGGTYWMKGFHQLAADIRGRCNHAVILAGEGCGESWLPYLDLMLSLQVSKERYAGPDGWETIPFFNAVYHPFAVTYGNYSSLTMPPYDDLWPAQFAPTEPLKLLDRKFSRQFCLEQARAFVWGQQPTVANFRPSHFEQRPEEMEYALQLARLRSRAAKYLLHGVFLRPPELQAPQATIDMSRLSIYAGQQDGLKAFEKPSALALAGAWRAPDGDVAIALASIADEPVNVSLRVDPRACGLPKAAKVFVITDQGRQELAPAKQREGMLMNLRLAPRRACLLELARE